jgi:hypothetical protein
MKLMQAIVVAAVTVLCAGTTFGEVVIREVQLKWEEVAELNGDVVFNNICAVCHGVGGKGDGPAVSALEYAVPDLTVLAANNDGVYPHKQVKNVIFGGYRGFERGTRFMPYWGEHFMYLGVRFKKIPHRKYAWERVHTLSTHVESLQVN